MNIPTFVHGDAVVVKFPRKGGKSSFFKGKRHLQLSSDVIPKSFSAGSTASDKDKKGTGSAESTASNKDKNEGIVKRWKYRLH